MLRARMLDFFIGDWDRHEGQWRWEEARKGSQFIYTPLPRDRDKVYYNTSGVFPWLLARQNLKSNLQGFKDKIRDVPGYNFNNRYFDRLFLNELSEDDWKEQISDVESIMTDELIKTAVHKLPADIFALSGKKIINTLIARRASLRKDALTYYKFLAQKVDVTATDKADNVEISEKNNGNVGITIFKTGKKGANKILYQRTFDQQYTKEIRLYGLGDKDVFSVTGSLPSPIKVRMIGGEGVDSFQVDDQLYNKNKLYVYDDRNNLFPKRPVARMKISADSNNNKFDPHNFKYDRLGPVFSLLYSMDLGLILKAGMMYEKHGFRKEPFAEKHLFEASYATVRQSFMFEYESYLTKVLRNNNISIHLLSRGPKNVTSFFGIGNDTRFINTPGAGINYYRNRFDLITADIRIRRNISPVFAISGGVLGQYYTSSSANNSSHFFEKYNYSNPDENIYSNRIYAGVVAGAVLDTRNNGFFSSKGIFWNTELNTLRQLNNEKKSTGAIQSEFNFYIPLSSDSGFVMANRVGGGTTFGSPAFFQQMQLGGIKNLRGFHTYRFTGRTMFYHNVELRCKLFDFNSYLFPGRIGVVGFNDIGRVWTPGEVSVTWHEGYGGGLYIIPAELFLIQAVVGHSVEGTLPYISIGFTF